MVNSLQLLKFVSKMDCKDWEVWKKARKSILQGYSLSSCFLTTEKYGLTSQIGKCAVTVPSTIAVGYGRRFTKNTMRFYI